jgi:hypothetical protein
MAVERVFHCDWRDCVTHVRTTLPHAPDFITIVERDPAGERELHFHSWDCVLRYAGEMEPEEVVAWTPDGADDD